MITIPKSKMEIKNGVVKAVQSDGTWDSQHGLFYRWEVTIGDDTGLYLSKDKDQKRFIVGQNVSYQWDGNKNRIKYQNPDYQKPYQSNDNSSGPSQRDQLIVKQNALGNAVQFFASGGCQGDQILDTAEMFANWVLKGEKPSKPKQSDDLPF